MCVHVCMCCMYRPEVYLMFPFSGIDHYVFEIVSLTLPGTYRLALAGYLTGLGDFQFLPPQYW